MKPQGYCGTSATATGQASINARASKTNASANNAPVKMTSVIGSEASGYGHPLVRALGLPLGGRSLCGGIVTERPATCRSSQRPPSFVKQRAITIMIDLWYAPPTTEPEAVYVRGFRG